METFFAGLDMLLAWVATGKDEVGVVSESKARWGREEGRKGCTSRVHKCQKLQEKGEGRKRPIEQSRGAYTGEAAWHSGYRRDVAVSGSWL